MSRGQLVFTPKALEAIALEAQARRTGARGLRSILEGLLTEAMFDVPDLAKREQVPPLVLVDEASAKDGTARIVTGADAIRDALQEAREAEKVPAEAAEDEAAAAAALTPAACLGMPDTAADEAATVSRRL